MELFDTHCHIQSSENRGEGEAVTRSMWEKAGFPPGDEIIARAKQAGVTRMICVGCTLEDSELAIDFVKNRQNLYASIGIHPHEAKDYEGNIDKLEQFAALASRDKVVAIGECGLDYYYNHSSKETQVEILKFQIELALQHDLPLIFHVREAFDDFWPIFDQYTGIRGVIHSFTDTKEQVEEIVKRGLYIGLNGIMTFTKAGEQLTAAKVIPLDRLLLETDAPFLTPAPYRGKICEPYHMRVTAEFLSVLRNKPLEDIAAATTHSAKTLFNLT